MDKAKREMAKRKIKALMRQGRELRAYLSMAPVKTEVARANLAIARMDGEDPRRDLRTREVDEVLTLLHLARFTATEAARTKDRKRWKRAFAYFSQARRDGLALRKALERDLDHGAFTPSPFERGRLGAIVETADGVPLVPEILPVVFLSGTDREMGRQYALQVAALFGTWIFERKSGRNFSTEQRRELSLWEKELATHAPEFIAFAAGMAEGAASLGLPMSYEHALELWTGTLPPEKEHFGAGGERMSTIPPLACSGVAAWGRATSDGKLVTGSAGDFDPTFTVTIFAWPETGNAFVFQPFGATGDVPGLGSVNMFGHPGMNDKGVVYVHHGGTPKMIEPTASWGYGLRRTPGVMHALRYASTAAQAVDIELSYPVGDVGIDSGTVGGFWADDREGFVIESRKDPVLIRKAGLLGETDFLYSANSPLHPEAGEHGWIVEERDQWIWEAPGGWRPRKYSFFNKLGLVYHGSAQRSAAFFYLLDREKGKAGFDTMVKAYATGGTLPEGTWRAIARAYPKTGAWGQLSPGNPSNGTLVFTKPSEGRYSAGLGALGRGLAPTSPLFASINPLRASTWAYWDLYLKPHAGQIATRAEEDAVALIEKAEAALESPEAKRGCRALARAEDHLADARHELELGRQVFLAAGANAGTERLGHQALAVTRFTRAQVRAKQALAEFRLP